MQKFMLFVEKNYKSPTVNSNPSPLPGPQSPRYEGTAPLPLET